MIVNKDLLIVLRAPLNYKSFLVSLDNISSVTTLSGVSTSGTSITLAE
mgnify:CR=1 FL=1